MKLAILTSHPIQYQTPFFRKLTRKGIDCTVYFCWTAGLTSADHSYFDDQFGKEVKWDIPLLEGFRYEFLKNYSFHPSSNFWGQINPGIVRALVKNRYDAILIYGWNSFTIWLVFFAAIASRTPIFLHGENPMNQELKKDLFRRLMKNIVLRLLFASISVFLYIGQENKKFYEYYGVPPKKLFFTPYAVDTDRFIAEAQRLEPHTLEIKKKFGIKGSTILFVGKLIPKKRPMDLLLAYELMIENGNKSELFFVGDGELRTKLEAYAKEKNLLGVRFVGFKNQTELPEYYSIADVLVLPSGIGETWGLVMNEAMCFKTAIITSDVVGGGPDVVHPGENGFIFPVGNVEVLASFLMELLGNSKNLRDFGERSLKIVQEYSYDKDAERILKAWNSLKH